MVACEDRKSSTHRAEVVELKLERHPNADRLSVARVDGYTCVTETTQWAGKDRAVYLPPDSLVDVRRDEFAFLAPSANSEGKARIKAKKLRGALSFGLLVPAPDGAELGQDVADQLGVEHYEPPIRGDGGNRGGLVSGGEVAAGPPVYHVKYDLEAGRKYAQKVFVPGEPVVVTEKIHGANARYVFVDGQMYCGSRTEWKKEYPDHSHVTVEALEGKVGRERAEEIVAKLKDKPRTRNLWWQALDRTPSLLTFCMANPGTVVYGEVYGAVQDLNYGHEKGEVSFAAFDMMKDGQWLDANEAVVLADQHGVPWVPLLNKFAKLGCDCCIDHIEPIPFDFDRVCEMAEGQSLVPGANHLREGVVVRPLKERRDDRVGRVVLKWVGGGYLERAK